MKTATNFSNAGFAGWTLIPAQLALQACRAHTGGGGATLLCANWGATSDGGGGGYGVARAERGKQWWVVDLARAHCLPPLCIICAGAVLARHHPMCEGACGSTVQTAAAVPPGL
ncbi:hypothetical protein QAD02_003951 [Eretmocerus hayati]|uniref:Uncharacterized protein n=1 Tax=Eretmocerus hayati TaxID=131215 RepID=A0ACC2NP58_9HYME|nr:hypothetical protein QAD02_003951 [Eretmocerus hayati]